jgi:thiamine pyrophosphokinase
MTTKDKENKSKFCLFLNHKYPPKAKSFYMKRIVGAITIAVDGGIRFFINNNLSPDYLIGDMDSCPKITKRILIDTKVIIYPSIKDKTDSHLAVDLALERGAKAIEIFGGISVDEIDHALGNIFLLEIINRWNKAKNTFIPARLASPLMEIYLLHDKNLSLEGRIGDSLSIIPLGYKTAINFGGLKYPPPKRRLNMGDTLPLRNEFSTQKCRIAIGGKAIIVHTRKIGS